MSTIEPAGEIMCTRSSHSQSLRPFNQVQQEHPPIEKCYCLSCSKTGEASYLLGRVSSTCRFPNCKTEIDVTELYLRDARDHRKRHERGHCLIFETDLHQCPVSTCQHVTKKWSDLIRHTKDIHCRKSKLFACQVIGCERSGDNGFKRPYRLEEHTRKVHQGGFTPARRYPTLAPAPTNDNGVSQGGKDDEHGVQDFHSAKDY